MARPGPGGQQESPASSTGEEAPSAQAELHIVKIPPDSDHTVASQPWGHGGEDEPGRLLTLWRRTGFGVHARVRVPAADSRELLVAFRCATFAIAWALTTLITLLATVTIGMAATPIIIIIALELAGFAVAALTARRRRGRE